MKVFYERHKQTRDFTGVTVVDLDGYLGFAFCHQGEAIYHKNAPSQKGINYYSVKEVIPDQFCRKDGRKLALVRALKLKGQVEAGKNQTEIFKEIYSGRLQRKISDYFVRNKYRFDETVDKQE